MLEVTVFTLIGLSVVGVPMAFALSVIAGLLNFVPNFGPLVAMVPAVLVGLMTGFDTALIIAAPCNTHYVTIVHGDPFGRMGRITCHSPACDYNDSHRRDLSKKTRRSNLICNIILCYQFLLFICRL